MSFTLHGIITRPPTTTTLVRRLQKSIVLPYNGVRLTPMTGELFHDVLPDGWASAPRPEFSYLAPEIESVLLDVSFAGLVVYVEVECFGGSCGQAAIGWTDGVVAFGPDVLRDGDPIPDSGTPAERALAALGVVVNMSEPQPPRPSTWNEIGIDSWRWVRIPGLRSPPTFPGHEPFGRF